MENTIQVPVACALIKNKEGQVLFQRRADNYIPDADDRWEFTGGRVDFGERPEDAVVRECREEIGCEVVVKRLIPYIHSNVWQRADGSTAHVLVMCFEVEITSGTPKPTDEKVAEVRWFAKDEIQELDVLPGIKEFIEVSES